MPYCHLMRYYSPFPEAIPLIRAGYSRVTHPSATKLRMKQASLLTPFDLHVLSVPPAFVLSQDQTLYLKLYNILPFYRQTITLAHYKLDARKLLFVKLFELKLIKIKRAVYSKISFCSLFSFQGTFRCALSYSLADSLFIISLWKAIVKGFWGFFWGLEGLSVLVEFWEFLWWKCNALDCNREPPFRAVWIVFDVIAARNRFALLAISAKLSPFDLWYRLIVFGDFIG